MSSNRKDNSTAKKNNSSTSNAAVNNSTSNRNASTTNQSSNIIKTNSNTTLKTNSSASNSVVNNSTSSRTTSTTTQSSSVVKTNGSTTLKTGSSSNNSAVNSSSSSRTTSTTSQGSSVVKTNGSTALKTGSSSNNSAVNSSSGSRTASATNQSSSVIRTNSNTTLRTGSNSNSVISSSASSKNTTSQSSNVVKTNGSTTLKTGSGSNSVINNSASNKAQSTIGQVSNVIKTNRKTALRTGSLGVGTRKINRWVGKAARFGGNGALFVGNGIKNDIKTSVNSFANGKILKSTNLDKNHHEEMGVNGLKATYNTVLHTKKAAEQTVKTAKKITEIPRRTREIIRSIREIPQRIKTGFNNVKKASKAVGTASMAIYGSLKTGGVIGALKVIPIKKIGKASLKAAAKGTGKGLLKSASFSKKATLRSVNQLGKNFKNAALSKSEGTNDLGSNAVFATIETAKQTVRVTTKATRTTFRASKKINTARKRILKSNTLKGIKTRISKSVINTKLKFHFDKFKSSYASKKAIKKYINKLADKLKEAVKYLLGSIIKNPAVLGIIAVVLILFLLITSILNVFAGTHGSLFVQIDPEQQQWISAMNKLDSDMKRRVQDNKKNVTTIKKGNQPDWRDVIVAYYIKNNYNSSIASGTYTSLGGTAESVDPETWGKIYAELQAQIGKSYVWGATGPDTFDCSGLVQYCYGKYGIKLPRTTYEQVLQGTHVERSDLKAGDLVFFGTSDDIHHVGVYIGNNQYLHAPQTGDVVKISDMTRSDYYEGRRVFEVKENSSSSDSKTNSDSKASDSKTDSDHDKILYTALPNHKDLVDIFYRVEKETGVDAVLLASIAMTESSMNPNDVNKQSGAAGLCQLMPDTFVNELHFDISMIMDPYTNVLACAKEISDLYNRYKLTNVTDVLTAYNGGIGNFWKYNGPMPNQENQQYAPKVKEFYRQLSNGQQPADMQGGSGVGAGSGVNATLAQVYNCFVKLYKKPNSEHTWILQYYTVEEALDNLKFTPEEKDMFKNIREYNQQFMEKDQFEGIDVDFKFNIR